MKVRGRDVWDGMGALSALSQVKFKPAAALTIARVRRSVHIEWQTLEEMRQAMLKEYGAFAKEGAQQYEFPAGKQELFEQAWKECLEAEIELPFGVGISFDKLGLPDIEPVILEAILWLFANSD